MQYIIAICDDDTKELHEAEKLCKEYGEKNKINLTVWLYTSSVNLKDSIKKNGYPDILLLDIYMPDENGIETAEFLRNHGFSNPIIFLTSSTGYAMDAYRLDALQYFVKPLESNRFFDTLNKAFLLQKEKKKQYLILRVDGVLQKIPLAEIIYCEAQKHNKVFYLEKGIQKRSRLTMEELSKYLKERDGFVQVGNSYIINLYHVTAISSKEVLFDTEMALRLPRGAYTSLRDSYFRYYCEEE